MGRIIKASDVRRNEILDVAQRLIYTKGYEQMAIQDILNELKISKGAFYHYYNSKQALLEALIEHLMQEVEKILNPILEDPNLTALEKLQRYFDTVARWKTAQKTYLLGILRAWYTDENAILRQKMAAMSRDRIMPLLRTIIHQGVQEGILKTNFPDRVDEVVFSIMMGLSDALAGLLLSREQDQNNLQRIESTVAAYTDALERVLGAPPASLTLVDAATLREWVVA